MLKERLSDLDIKITELANYLNISRPTMYKFIDYYESGNNNDINKKVLKLFNYIVENPLIGKNNVISYILNNLADVKDMEAKEESDLYKDVRRYILDNPDSEKSKFLNLCCKKGNYDLVIHYLMEISPLLKKSKLDEEELKMLKPYKDIINMYIIEESEDK